MNWRNDVDAFKKAMVPEEPAVKLQSLCFTFFGLSGGGKSTTAGICAVGIAPEGLIGWVDGEGGRSGIAIKRVIEMAMAKYGGTEAAWKARFKVVPVEAPYNPLKAIAAKECLEEAGCKVIIMDLMSQCWDSEGGYLDMKEQKIDELTHGNESQRQRFQQMAGSVLKPWTHQRLVNAVNTSKTNLILVFQAKAKWDSKANKVADIETPIQEGGFTRTSLAAGRVETSMVDGQSVGGFCFFQGDIRSGVKTTHPEVARRLPQNGQQFTFDHARSILEWATGVSSPAPATAPKSASTTKSWRKQVWELLESVHKGDTEKFRDWLWKNNLISDEESELGLKALADKRWEDIHGEAVKLLGA